MLKPINHNSIFLMETIVSDFFSDNVEQKFPRNATVIAEQGVFFP